MLQHMRGKLCKELSSPSSKPTTNMYDPLPSCGRDLCGLRTGAWDDASGYLFFFSFYRIKKSMYSLLAMFLDQKLMVHEFVYLHISGCCLVSERLDGRGNWELKGIAIIIFLISEAQALPLQWFTPYTSYYFTFNFRMSYNQAWLRHLCIIFKWLLHVIKNIYVFNINKYAKRHPTPPHPT